MFKCLEGVEKQQGEGLVVRCPFNEYKTKTNHRFYKVKKWHTDEAMYVCYIQGKGRNTGELGALGCITRLGTFLELGTGLTDEMRSDANFVPPIGSIVEFKHRKNQQWQGDKFVHPIYLRKRPDLTHEDLNLNPATQPLFIPPPPDIACCSTFAPGV